VSSRAGRIRAVPIRAAPSRAGRTRSVPTPAARIRRRST